MNNSIFLQLSDELGSKDNALIAIDLLYDLMAHAKEEELTPDELKEVWHLHARLCIDAEYTQYMQEYAGERIK